VSLSVFVPVHTAGSTFEVDREVGHYDTNPCDFIVCPWQSMDPLKREAIGIVQKHLPSHILLTE
jgi:hypothetical protein